MEIKASIRRERKRPERKASMGAMVVHGSPGGLVIPGGTGSASDKVAQGRWEQGGLDFDQAEAVYRSSWAAKRALKLPVEDAFAKWRVFVADKEDRERSENAERAMREAERRHRVREHLEDAMLSARIHGTSCVALVTADDDPMEPLDPTRIRPGDLKALHVLDAYSMAATDYVADWADPHFGQPSGWRLVTRYGNEVVMHPSRVLVFYGERPRTVNGQRSRVPSRLGQWAGLSILETLMKAVGQEEMGASATAQLLAENASVIVGDPELLDESEEDGATTQRKLTTMALRRSVFGTTIVDDIEAVKRLTAPISGAAPVLTMLEKRIAHAAGIPEARFLGASATGFSSGEPEHVAYGGMILTLQQTSLAPVLDQLDPVLAADAGLAEAPTYQFVPLVEHNAQTRAETLAVHVRTARELATARLATPDEVRDLLRTDETLDEVLAEELPDEVRDRDAGTGADDGREPGGADDGDAGEPDDPGRRDEDEADA